MQFSELVRRTNFAILEAEAQGFSATADALRLVLDDLLQLPRQRAGESAV
ncbi:hypothetical protein N9M66_00310 [Litoreibacter sp.]|nr:hypothetical protein [Litoreibacter sp.]